MKGLANVGDVLGGKYKVERILGIGGMGMVVLATHMELEQSVAIKFMLPQAMENPEAVSRFMREARAAGRLTNDHVCRVSDVGKFESGAPYIVMEYMEGQDLGTLIKRKGAQPVATAVDFIVQGCEGMAEAHGHGIVHRDLKPDNLFLATRADGNEIIKILDFGISKAAVTGIATRTGDIMGSPAYMAPEQMQSTKDVDERADIWSLGVILYQLISGRMPFIADTLPALCLAVINDPPPSLESIRKDLPHGLAQVVMKCLTKSRDERYRNVYQLALALAPYGKPESASATTRIRSMLQRKRPPTPPPLMMLPSEFSDVAPTIVGDDESSPVPKVMTPMPSSATKTTLGGSAGESLAIPAKRVNKGVIGALLGAIALVGLIIVMVMIKRGNGTAAANQPAPQPTQVVKDPPPPVPEKMTVEAIDSLGSAEARSDAERRGEAIDAAAEVPTPNLVVVEGQPVVDQGSGSAAKPKPKKKDPKKDPQKAPIAKDPGSAAPPPDDDDKWSHMQHDGDKESAPPKDPPKDPAP